MSVAKGIENAYDRVGVRGPMQREWKLPVKGLVWGARRMLSEALTPPAKRSCR